LLDPDPYRIRILVVKFDDTIKGSNDDIKNLSNIIDIPIHNYGYQAGSVVDPNPVAKKIRKKFVNFIF